jgi:transposase
LKSEEQLDMQSLHRARDRLVGERTALMNQFRSLLLERGFVVPQGKAKLASALADPVDGEAGALASNAHADDAHARTMARARQTRCGSRRRILRGGEG